MLMPECLGIWFLVFMFLKVVLSKPVLEHSGRKTAVAMSSKYIFWTHLELLQTVFKVHFQFFHVFHVTGSKMLVW